MEPKILVVDDNPKNREMASLVLEENGYKVTHANSGEDALEIIGKEKPDLILLDVNMGGMDGFQTCLQIKEDQKNRDIAVLFFTGERAVEDIVRSFEVGGRDYVSKPFIEEELLARVKSQIQIKRAKEKDITSAKRQVMTKMSLTCLHEILNPLTIASGHLSLVDSENQEVKDHLDKIKDAMERSVEIVNKLRNINEEKDLDPEDGQVYLK
jgi:DNA-binding response OmpR family regulator